MAKLDFDSAEVTVPCPQCRHEAKHRIGRLRREGHFDCVGCGVRVDVDASSYDKTLRGLNKSLEQLFKP